MLAVTVRVGQGSAGRIGVWENVPGVLFMADNAFGCFLAGLVGADAPLLPTKECGGRWTNAGLALGPRRTAGWRVLDSQYFGLAQRRERVFVVASPRRAELPFQILFEPEGGRRHTAPRRETKQRVAPTLEGRAGRSGANNFATSGGLVEAFGGNNTTGPIHVATACNAHGGTGRHDFESETFVTFQTRIARNGRGYAEDVTPALNGTDAGATSDMRPCVAFRACGQGGFSPSDVVPPIIATNGGGAGVPTIAQGYAVRRLTARECERLQGFPDDWTLVPNAKGKPMADGPRYKMLGNAVSVPVAEWLARRILRYL